MKIEKLNYHKVTTEDFEYIRFDESSWYELCAKILFDLNPWQIENLEKQFQAERLRKDEQKR